MPEVTGSVSSRDPRACCATFPPGALVVSSAPGTEIFKKKYSYLDDFSVCLVLFLKSGKLLRRRFVCVIQGAGLAYDSTTDDREKELECRRGNYGL